MIPTDHLFGIPLSTHRIRDAESSSFLYESAISAAAVLFFRTTIYRQKEPRLLRWFFGVMLAFLAYTNKSYELISAVEMFSYAVPFLLHSDLPSHFLNGSVKDSKLLRLLFIGLSAIVSLIVCHLVASGDMFLALGLVTPSWVMEGLSWLFPIEEVQAAYDIIDHFILEPTLLQTQIARLLFITFHIQVGIGYLGIHFLNKEQERRNRLVRMDMIGDDDQEEEDEQSPQKNGKKQQNGGKKAAAASDTKKLSRAKRFQKSAAPFIFFVAVPYMVQIIGYGNLNAFAFACFKDDVHRAVRLYDLFEHDNNLVAMSLHSAKGPAAYAGFMNTVVDTTYQLVNRKLFSLPKVLLLPTMMARQPMLMAQLFPIIFTTDWMKGRAITYMTNRIETLEKQRQELDAMRSKVEAFDIKNAELLQRAGPGATQFTQRRWEELTVQIQTKEIVKDLVLRTKMFFGWIERNFVFSVLVDCALAQLIAVGRIATAEIFVFSRAIEDAVDMALMRSRSEAELARMVTQIDNLKELSTVWDEAKSRNLLNCNLAPPAVTKDSAVTKSLIVVRNLHYSRGTATVRADHLELKAGTYALTGPNGSGKSTLFRVLMSCKTNDRSIDLPTSITLSTPTKPLIEEDDLERELGCEAADEGTIEEEAEIGADGTIDTAGRKLAEIAKDIHPRLSITMPSSQVVEISQTFYWPLYSKPIDWIYQEHVSETCDKAELEKRVRRVAEELHSLQFTQAMGNDQQEGVEADSDSEVVTLSSSYDAMKGIMNDLLEEKEDWFADLSGGQKSKVELVRKVFLHDECPHVLLVDETMAPLDPTSKSLVMAKLKKFCSASVVIVIYHSDVGREHDGGEGEMVECVPSNDFFDGNIHVENQVIQLRPIC